MLPAIAETSTRLLIGPRADNKSVLSGIGACKVPENREKTTGHLPGALLYFTKNLDKLRFLDLVWLVQLLASTFTC